MIKIPPVQFLESEEISLTLILVLYIIQLYVFGTAVIFFKALLRLDAELLRKIFARYRCRSGVRYSLKKDHLAMLF